MTTTKPRARRIRCNRGDINAVMAAALKASSETPLYVFPTAYGFVIDRNPAPFGNRCYRVLAGEVTKCGEWLS